MEEIVNQFNQASAVDRVPGGYLRVADWTEAANLPDVYALFRYGDRDAACADSARR